MRYLLAVLMLVSTTALAEPPKRWMSIWDFVRAYHAVVHEEQDERVVQEQPKAKEPPRWGWQNKPKPCDCLSPRTGGEAVNYPPYDVEP